MTRRRDPAIIRHMGEALVQGLLTGWAIAVPVGAVGALLVTVTARTSLRTGAAAALGVATVDGAYAALAVLGGAAVAAALAPAADVLRLVAAGVLLAVALVIARAAWQQPEAGDAPAPRGWAPRPAAAYAAFLGLTAVNPTTVVYFAAVVLGNRDLVAGPAEASVFVAAAFAASATWQLALAGGGAALGAAASGPRARRWSGLLSAAVVAGLAGWTLLG